MGIGRGLQVQVCRTWMNIARIFEERAEAIGMGMGMAWSRIFEVGGFTLALSEVATTCLLDWFILYL